MNLGARGPLSDLLGALRRVGSRPLQRDLGLPEAASAPVLAPGLTAPRAGVAALFFIQGAGAASWIVRIPAVQERLAIGAGALGTALLGGVIGSVVATPPAGWLVARVGSRAVAGVGALAVCVALVLPALAPSFSALVVSLVALGASCGAQNVAINAQAVALEKRYGRPILSSCHGLFSLGGLGGAAVGGLLAERGVEPAIHLAAVGLTLVLVSPAAARALLPDDSSGPSEGRVPVRPTRSLSALCAVAFCVLLGEGAMADWSAVYIHGSLGAGPGLAAAGYATFSFMMAAGRLAGDALIARLGPVRLLRLGGLTAASGLTTALLLGLPGATLLGFGCVGAGFATVFPTVLAAAGRRGDLAPSAAIATVSTAGFSGFIAGPLLIGFAAEALTLRAALGVVALCGVTIAALASSTSPSHRQAF